jgi:hypothetical protein
MNTGGRKRQDFASSDLLRDDQRFRELLRKMKLPPIEKK